LRSLTKHENIRRKMYNVNVFYTTQQNVLYIIINSSLLWSDIGGIFITLIFAISIAMSSEVVNKRLRIIG